ncbi:hypothetical protein GCM10007304_27300 [Rhodococcoides trifolii]|uniref:DUF222 domain-containing protein n=1 Tax=Rhodococcoides trifolii TaxID=908250 RepID=A0A917D7Q0_9NOCA|nr:hypothetical protein GCM10007304_27300 [Rhodococcus trifolii]
MVQSAAALVAALDETRRAVNRFDAQRVHYAYDLLDVRLTAELESGSRCAQSAARTATVDVAEALRLSQDVAMTVIEVGEQLWHRLPLLNAAFTAGEVDYRRVATTVSVLKRACDSTVAAVEAEAVAAAQSKTPGPLRDAVWSLWFDHDPDEARAAQEVVRKDNSRVYRRKRGDGLSDVVITTGDLAAQEFMDRIEQLVGTVCTNDPRSKGELQAAAATAMARDQNAIECRCGLDECPVAGLEVGPAPVRRIAAYMDIEVLLGLSSTPPTLADGTPLDPEVARVLAADARWQIILTEMRTVAAGYRRDNPAEADADSDSVDAESASEPIDADDLVEHCESAADGESGTPPPRPAPGVPTRLTSCRARVLLHRSRSYTAPTLPVSSSPPMRPKAHYWFRALNRHVADLLAQIAANPSLANGVHPDGHGGHLCPPKGALTYAPSAEVAALVRARYRKCVAPGCSTPSERCQLDHTVPFDHDDPMRGGWSIVENLGPLCVTHHQVKTERHWLPAIMADGFVAWRTDTGLIRVSAPAPGLITFASMALGEEIDAGRGKPWPLRASTPLPADLDAPTWWEHYHSMLGIDRWVTETAIATMRYGPDRDAARALRVKYLEHRAIVRARRAAEPAPF